MNNNLNFNKNGILIKKNFLKKKQKDLVKMVFREYFRKICYPHLEKNNFNIEDAEIQKKIIKYRAKFSKKFGTIYDDLKLNANLRSIFYDKLFIDLFANILGVNESRVFLNGFMFRFDAPFDQRNTLNWHQDSAYYQQTYPKFNAGVCWLGLTKNTEKNGTLVYIPKSNKNFVKNLSRSKKNKFHSELLRIKITKKEDLKTRNANTNFGDALIMHMNTKHRSGINTSGKIRMTLGVRFHDMSKGFHSGKELYFYNKINKPKLII